MGFYAKNVKTGKTSSWRSGERFVMCSTFKASLAALILHRADKNLDNLEERITYTAYDVRDMYAPVAQENVDKGFLTVQEMCKGAVEKSDNACANLLLARAGGPSALTAFWRSIGDETSRLDDGEPLLNRTPLGRDENTTTPRAMANTLKALVLGDVLAAKSARLLTTWLVDCETGANRLRSGLPGDWRTGDKTGNNGKDAAGDIAVAWTASEAPLVIAAYTRGGSPTENQFKDLFGGIARLAAASIA